MENLYIPKSSRTGTAFSEYTAIGIAEGFEECRDHEVLIEAWATIGQKGLHRGLQGWFGRSLHHLQIQEYLNSDFTVNWDMVDQAYFFNGGDE